MTTRGRDKPDSCVDLLYVIVRYAAQVSGIFFATGNYHMRVLCNPEKFRIEALIDIVWIKTTKFAYIKYEAAT